MGIVDSCITNFISISEGLPPDVLDRAREVARLEDKGQPIQPLRKGYRGPGRLTTASPLVGLLLGSSGDVGHMRNAQIRSDVNTSVNIEEPRTM